MKVARVVMELAVGPKDFKELKNRQAKRDRDDACSGASKAIGTEALRQAGGVR